MCLAPGVDIIHKLAKYLLINIVEHRVIGSEDKVGRSVLKYFINLSLQFSQVPFFQRLTTIVKTTKYRTMEEFTNVGKTNALILPVMEWWIDYTAWIIKIVV
jgi:hypothetical protein